MQQKIIPTRSKSNSSPNTANASRTEGGISKKKSPSGLRAIVSTGPEPVLENAELAVDDPARRRLPVLLRRAWYGLNQAFRRRISDLGSTPDQYTVLRTIVEHRDKGLNQRRLAELMASDPNTIAALVERMEQSGWIVRRPHTRDRRANLLALTPAGETQFGQLRARAALLQSEVLAGLRACDRERFLRLLEQVAGSCQMAAQIQPRKRTNCSTYLPTMSASRFTASPT